MKKLLLALGFVIAVIVAARVEAYALGVGPRHPGRTQTQQASFRIVVEATADGLTAQCPTGCAWTRATYACGPNAAKKTCKAEIDEKGIREAK